MFYIFFLNANQDSSITSGSIFPHYSIPLYVRDLYPADVWTRRLKYTKLSFVLVLWLNFGDINETVVESSFKFLVMKLKDEFG